MNAKQIIWKIVIIHLFIYTAVAFLYGCGMLKNTSKAKFKTESEQVIHKQRDQLDLSKLYRESQVYSYRPDGSVAKYEWKREQLDSFSLSRTSSVENQKQNTEDLIKKSSLGRTWILTGLLILMILGILGYRKYFFPE